MLRQRDIRRRFDQAAAVFDDADFVHAVTRDGLCARLEPLLLKPASILDLGAATGAMGRAVRKRFRGAHLVSVDLSGAMLAIARRNKRWFSRASFVQADARCLPFAAGTFDLIVANQLLPWMPDPQPLFVEVARVLRKGGVFAFAGLGPDSLQEIARAWAAVDTGAHVNRFPDMHDVGDGLVRAGLADPVLDVDRLSISYENPGKLFSDLTRAGARNSHADRASGLTGKTRFRAMADALVEQRSGDGILLDLELVYGHCWGAGPKNDPTAWHIDATQIPLRR
ncbi:MAG: methyltransferase domain-containing protein [Woeseiaceae bacterium]|nr:methyltransferase domain-containing protein [Woeseiaceae bacterium]